MKDRRQSKVRKSVKFRKLKFGNLKNSPYEIVKKKIPHPQSYNKLNKKGKIREKEKKKLVYWPGIEPGTRFYQLDHQSTWLRQSIL